MRRGWCVALLLAACMPALDNGAAVDGEANVPPELGSTLNVRVESDSVVFELHVTNVTTDPLRATFPTSQRYDFEVQTPDGAAVWRWSDDHMFAQVLGEEVLAPGESRQYRAAWSAAGRSGEHVATGRYTATNLPIELRTVVHLPAR